jgi:CheY-like chemotaxis protein
MRQLCSPVPEMCFIPHPQGDSPPLEADVNPSVTTPELSSQARHVRRSPPTCLIVEDEAAIRELMIHILAEAGYDVLAACNAEEAKQAIRAHGEPVALVISDIRMPGGSGLDLAVDLEAARPAVFFFRSKLTLPEGEGPASRSKLGSDGQRRAFTPAVILFIALPEAKDNIDPG